MSLYLCVFSKDGEDLDGVDVGHYSDFSAFRHAVLEHLESGVLGARFPTLMLHSDSDGEWTPADAVKLAAELEAIKEAFVSLPPVVAASPWQKALMKQQGLVASNLHESFFDVDGEPLVDRLLALCRLSKDVGTSIVFQ